MRECKQCGHPHDPHLMVVTGESPRDGGIMLCQVIGCQCFATWSAPQLGSTRETVRVPDRAAIEALRERFQGEYP